MVPNLYRSSTLYTNPNLNLGLLMIEVRIGKNATNSSILNYNNAEQSLKIPLQIKNTLLFVRPYLKIMNPLQPWAHTGHHITKNVLSEHRKNQKRVRNKGRTNE